MLRSYMKANNITSSSSAESNFWIPEIITDLSVQVTLHDDAIRAIKNEEPWKGFPLCASLFCSERKFLQLGKKYFTNPPRCLLEELKEIYQTAKKASNCIDKINDYCVLVYIMNNNNHQLDLNDPNLCSQLDELNQTLFHFKYIPAKPGSNEDQKKAIEKTLHRMNNTYLKFHGDIYEFIHPCLLKALFLSSDDLVYYLLLNGSLHDITDFVRSKGYIGMENELFIIVDDNNHDILSERLMRYAFENKQTLQHVAHYIYTYWRITGSELLKMIFTHVEYILYRSLGICTDNLQTIENERFSENEIKEKDQVTFYNISTLVSELTYNGKNPWIYGAGTTDFLVLIGLITAVMKRYETNRPETFKILLSEFKKRIHSKAFLKPLDKNENTFYHYLMLLSRIEASTILSVNEGRKHIFDTKNKLKYTPLDIAAYLGKTNILEIMNLKTHCTKTLQDRLSKLARSGKVRHYDENWKKCNSDLVFIDESCFDNFMHTVVDVGKREDYESIILLFSK